MVCGAVPVGSFLPSHPFFFLAPFHQCDRCLGSWLGCGDSKAMGAVFYLGAGWPQWKPLGIPGTHLPLKPSSWLNNVKVVAKALSNFPQNHMILTCLAQCKPLVPLATHISALLFKQVPRLALAYCIFPTFHPNWKFCLD